MQVAGLIIFLLVTVKYTLALNNEELQALR